MLKHLSIRNYALIDELELDISNGLTIITGETGAGKSILLGALSLIMGARADRTVLMEQNSKCIVEGVFDLSAHDLKDFFEENDLDFEEDTIIRREISGSGKTRSFINDTPVTLQELKALTEQLIDIHSQHETVLLNQPSYQLKTLDVYANLKEDVAVYQQRYREWVNICKELEELEAQVESDKEQRDFLNHQLEELEKAQLVEGEDDDLKAELKVMNNAENLKSSLTFVLAGLDHDEVNIISLMKSILKELFSLGEFSEKAQDLGDRLESSIIELQDIRSELEIMQEEVNFEPERHQWIEERLDLLNSLLHKHRKGSVGELIALREDLNSRFGSEVDHELRLKKLNETKSEKNEEVMKRARMIHDRRKVASQELCNEVSVLLGDLGMKDAIIDIELDQKEEPGIMGMDEPRFLFSANKGMVPKPIQKIASGGELSRLMLSLKSCVARRMAMPSIIFDEIDSGISGEIANMTGEIVKELSGNAQVISITHLPQMASKGDQHFKVFKNSNYTPPRTEVEILDENKRVEEIAKMLSGEKVTDQAIENAKVLLSD